MEKKTQPIVLLRAAVSAEPARAGGDAEALQRSLCLAPAVHTRHAVCTSDAAPDVSSPDAADASGAHEVTRLAGGALVGMGGGVEAARSSSACQDASIEGMSPAAQHPHHVSVR